MDDISILRNKLETLEQELIAAERKRSKLRHPTSIYAYNQQCNLIDNLQEAKENLQHELLARQLQTAI